MIEMNLRRLTMTKIKVDVNSVPINEGDYIVITYDNKITPAQEIKSVFDSICQEFKDRNRVIAIPNSMEIIAYNKSRMIEMLRNLLNELEGNNE